jgi:two-component system chemotaxis response regulator CheB
MLTAELQRNLADAAIEALVIGASAGGIEALSILLPTLSLGLAIPIVIVVHLPPRRSSLLPAVFQAKCAAPVREPVDKEPVAPGTIWFAAPDYHLLIERNRRFAYSTEPPVRFSRPAIDPLFESAAQAYGARLAAVVLSGASDDGANGAARVRELGGHLFVQDPREALSRTMPEAAIERAHPQFVGTLAEITALLSSSTGRSP